MESIILIAMVAAIAMAACKNKNVSGMEQTVSIENIKRGVANGWYTAVLTVAPDGRKAVRLTGKTQDGSTYTDIYSISNQDYATLLAEGYPQA